jgi:hypothetical protein
MVRAFYLLPASLPQIVLNYHSQHFPNIAVKPGERRPWCGSGMAVRRHAIVPLSYGVTTSLPNASTKPALFGSILSAFLPIASQVPSKAWNNANLLPHAEQTLPSQNIWGVMIFSFLL